MANRFYRAHSLKGIVCNNFRENIRFFWPQDKRSRSFKPDISKQLSETIKKMSEIDQNIPFIPIENKLLGANNLYSFIDITAIRDHIALKFTGMFCIIITNIFLEEKLNFRR